MSRIAVIIPYFGAWPKWFELYLYSCSFQQGIIDFYYFTDCGVPETVYENTHFCEISFEEYCDMVSDKLKIDFHPVNKYKLTDLKPFLGSVHSDIVSRYDFWAFADLDLVYGDMSALVNEKVLNRYDIITTHSDRIAGHFTAIRFGSKYDVPFEIADWKSRLENQNNCNLDEGAFTDVVYYKLRYLNKLCGLFGDWGWRNARNICSIVGTVFCNGITRRLFVEVNSTPVPSTEDNYIFDNGMVIKGPTQLPYLHFLFFKKTPYLNIDQYWDAESFYQVKDIQRQISISLSGISNVSER